MPFRRYFIYGHLYQGLKGVTNKWRQQVYQEGSNWIDGEFVQEGVEEQSDINYGHLNPQAELDLIPFSEVQHFAGVCNF